MIRDNTQRPLSKTTASLCRSSVPYLFSGREERVRNNFVREREEKRRKSRRVKGGFSNEFVWRSEGVIKANSSGSDI
jgi:hypothetical protein